MRLHVLFLGLASLLAAAPFSYAQGLVERAVFTGQTFRVGRTALSPDGKILASVGGDRRGGELKLWDVATGKETAALDAYTAMQSDLIFSPDSTKLLFSSGLVMQVWDVISRKEIIKSPKGEWTNAVGFSRDGNRLASVSGTKVRVWDLTNGKDVASWIDMTLVSQVMAFSRDLATLAVANHQEIDLWNVTTGKQRATFSEHRGEIEFLRYSADGRTLIGTSTHYYGRNFKWNGDVKLWDVATGKTRADFKGPFGRVLVAELSPNGKTLALLDSPELAADPDLKIVDVRTGRQHVISSVPAHAFTSLAFTMDGRLFLMGTPDDKIVKLWEVSLSNAEDRPVGQGR
jgi:WD40 repeat protein